MTQKDPVQDYINRFNKLKTPRHPSLTSEHVREEYTRGDRGSCYIITTAFTTDRLRRLVDKHFLECADASTTLRSINYVIPLTGDQITDPEMLSALKVDRIPENQILSAIIGRADINNMFPAASRNAWVKGMSNLTEVIMANKFGRQSYGVRTSKQGGIITYFNPQEVITRFSPELARLEFPQYS